MLLMSAPLECDACGRESGTKYRKVLLGVLHGLHVVVPQTEVDVESLGYLIAILREQVIPMRDNEALRVANRDRALGQVSGQEVCEGSNVLVIGIPRNRSIAIGPFAAEEAVGANRVTMIELVNLGTAIFAAHAQLVLSLDPVESFVDVPGDILPAFGRRVAGGFKVVADD